MDIKSMLAVATAIMLGIATEAAISVSDVTARQRYPWNGLVDITCSVSGIDGETNGLKLVVAAVMPDTGRVRNVSQYRMELGGEWSDAREVRTNGNYRLLWDAAADLAPVRFTNMVVRVTFDAHEKVQLWEGGPYWATTNIGAEKPEEYGLYFWWGDTIGYRREGDRWVASDGSSQNFSFEKGNTPTHNKSPAALRSEGWITTDDALVPEHDAAQVKWGGGWRMPTHQELSDLNSKCDWTWTTLNSVNGYVVRGRGAYSNDSIFLPCASYGGWTSLYSPGFYGGYWSSVQCSQYYYGSKHLDFDYCGQHSTSTNERYFGYSIRPVQGFAE